MVKDDFMIYDCSPPEDPRNMMLKNEIFKLMASILEQHKHPVNAYSAVPVRDILLELRSQLNICFTYNDIASLVAEETGHREVGVW